MERFNFKDLSDDVRREMLNEVTLDINHGTVYMSKRFSENGNRLYTDLLKKAIMNGNDETLARDLDINECFASHYSSIIYFAQSEFNHYYMRAICVIADREGKKVRIYRAKRSKFPRLESEHNIGKVLEPREILDKLRNNRFDESLPVGRVYSGLSLEIV